jgi:NADH-quinone oxidoreductase subunit J
MNSILFFILSILTVGSALMVIFSRSPISSILYLVLAFFSLAAFYVLLGAQFLAAVQIIVYAGAIMVLFLFVVMLLNLKQIEEKGKTILKAIGVVTAGILLILFILVTKNLTIQTSPSGGLVPTKSLGELLFTRYLIPFEIASVLLLVALVGAVVLVKKRNI